MSDRRINETARDLIAAKKLIENPEKWWDGKQGEGSICAVIAVDRVAGTCDGESMNALYLAADELFGLGAISVNDYFGHAAVMQMFDRAIEMALSAGMKSDAA